MAKAKSIYSCQSCGAIAHRWQGQCGDCGAWNSLIEEAANHNTNSNFAAKHDLQSGGQAIKLESLHVDIKPPPRLQCNLPELDRVLGGGFVSGSAVLIGGDPGVGKSTLLLQVAGKLALNGRQVVYISGEEAVAQIRLRAQRLGLSKAAVALASLTSVRDILASLSAMQQPDLLIIDSIQTMYSDLIEAAPGTVSQVRAAAQQLIRYAKEQGVALVLVGHVTKDGTIAGPRVLEHMVDCVLSFEGEHSQQYRILRAMKNRFGGTDEIGVFAMERKGLIEIANPSSLFLAERARQVPGTVVFPAMEGLRPLLVEIQALTVRQMSGAPPRRAVVGWDAGRLAMILAVIEARCGLSFAQMEVYLNIAGGYRVIDPAADMAVAVALVSAYCDRAVSSECVAFGEIALSGEVRPVPHASLRLREAAKLGFTQGWMRTARKAKDAPDSSGRGASGEDNILHDSDKSLADIPPADEIAIHNFERLRDLVDAVMGKD